VGDVPFYVKIRWILTPLQNADFQSIFARGTSAVTPSKKIQLTLIESRCKKKDMMMMMNNDSGIRLVAQNSIYEVLSIFNDNLFALNHSDNAVNS